MTLDEILAIDQAHAWHPYTSTIDRDPVYPVRAAQRLPAGTHGRTRS
jgi:adenosylmethionine---8-amino-7-oxononanoate aminotransferase